MFNQIQHLSRLQRALVRQNNQTTPDPDFLMVAVVDDMMDRLGAVKRKFDHGIALFGRNSYLYDAMENSPQVKSVTRVEEAVYLGKTDTISSPTNLKLKKLSADLILAPLSLHWSNDLPGTLIQLRRTLRPDGLLMGVLPGPGTLHELRGAMLSAESEISGGAGQRVDAFTDIKDAGALLQRTDYALPVVDQDTLTVRYDTALDLVRDLRAFGVGLHLQDNNNPPLTRKIIARMGEVYAQQHSDPDGRIRASFNLISLAGWVPEESQQKPLAPSTTKKRLAKTLKAPVNKN